MAYLCHRSLPLSNELEFLPRNGQENAEEDGLACECGATQRVRGPYLQEVHDADKHRLQHQRWHAAVKAAPAVDPTRTKIECYETQSAFRPRNGSVDNLVSGVDVDTDTHFRRTMWATALNLCVIPILYGGIHLTAWASEFPSGVECLLRRCSSISIMLTMLAWPWFAIMENVRRNGCRHWLTGVAVLKDRDWARNGVTWLVVVPVVLVLWLALTAVLAASILRRFYLVVESFVSLREVPVGVYWVPSWLKYIPHV